MGRQKRTQKFSSRKKIMSSSDPRLKVEETVLFFSVFQFHLKGYGSEIFIKSTKSKT